MELGSGLFVIMIFIAVVLLIEGGYLLWNEYRGPEVKRLGRRLRALSASQHGEDVYSLLKRRRNIDGATLLDQFLLALPRVSSLDRLLMQSGFEFSVGQFGFLTLIVSAAFFLVPLAIGVSFLVAVVFALIGAALPMLMLLAARSRRLAKFEQQLPDALDLMSRALRAGHAFGAALQMVGSEAAEPIASEFSEAFEEINYGVSLNDAMLNLSTRVPSIDMRYFVVSVILQRETGGNLAELLNKLSHLIRERFKLLGKVRVLAAEGKLSAYILIALPFATAGLLLMVNPGSLAVLWTDPVGLNAIYAALVLIVLGAFWMYRIVNIRV
ncbi:MAG: type II secretion system F family protein [Quisquiliibacterium sp.]